MTKQAITSSDIQQKLNSLEADVAQLNSEKAKLAFLATSGDATATARLEEIRQAISKIDFDRGTLDAAMVEARRLEKEAREEEERQERQRHVDAATDLAIELRGVCEKIDGMASDYADLLMDVDRLEQAIRTEHQRGKIRETAANALRSGISERVMSMFAALRGPIFNRERPMVEVMDRAWCHLPGYAAKYGQGK